MVGVRHKNSAKILTTRAFEVVVDLSLSRGPVSHCTHARVRVKSSVWQTERLLLHRTGRTIWTHITKSVGGTLGPASQ